MSFSLRIRDIEDLLSGQTIGITTGSILKTHCGWMSTILNDAVYDPDLEFVVKPVPNAAVPDFISTEAGHSSAFFVAAVRATEAALLSDQRRLATSRAKITGGCYLYEVFHCAIWHPLQAARLKFSSLPITVPSQRLKARAIPSGMDLTRSGPNPLNRDPPMCSS